MSISSAIGAGCTYILDGIVRAIVRSRVITPNILTLTGLLINVFCAWLYGLGYFVEGGLVLIFANVFVGYAMGFSRHFPEYLTFVSAFWIVASIVWGTFSAEARSLTPPPLFPRTDRPASQIPQRPEEDALPDEDEDEHATAAPHTSR